MTDDIIEIFNKRAEQQFRPLIEEYGYSLKEIQIRKNGVHNWATCLTYINNEKNLRIEILQEPFYTDYGFSFILYKEGTEEYNILYNVPHEKQGPIATVLKRAYKDLFSNHETLDLISGRVWKELKRIPFHK